ncbi:ABC transporter permease [Clostridium gasigenes]|uniref:ABC transporter permease n=1 Tax=Clostridium gasigenes TaxID=94869 RepID=UPI001C0C04EA|nr:ABC transporter permease [Clostridium gasigenes]MBU3107527.1 ABC transporter permease [Clostridium gasigenes]
MFLAMKDLKYNKSKYSLVVSMLILLTFMVLFLSGLANGLSLATSASIKNAEANHYIISDDADSIITRSTLTEKQFKEVNDMTSSEVTPINLMRMNMYKKDSQKKLDVTYLAVDKESFMMPSIIDGGEISDEQNTILLNNSFLEEEISIGDTIIDSGSGIEMKVTGFVKDEMFGHSSVGIMSLNTFKNIRTQTNKNYEIVYNAIAIKGEDIANIEIANTQVLSKDTIIKNIPGYAEEQMSINMILWVLLVVSAVILGVFFYIITTQKLTEFGVMKALGMEMKTLAVMIISQVFILAGGSMLLGNILTFTMSAFLPSSMPFSLQVESAVIISIAFLIISILVSLVSLRTVGKVDPLMTIGGHE